MPRTGLFEPFDPMRIGPMFPGRAKLVDRDVIGWHDEIVETRPDPMPTSAAGSCNNGMPQSHAFKPMGWLASESATTQSSHPEAIEEHPTRSRASEHGDDLLDRHATASGPSPTPTPATPAL